MISEIKYQTNKLTSASILIVLLLIFAPNSLFAQLPPPQNFSINPVTSVATWNPPDSSANELLGYMMFIDSSTITIINDTTFDFGYFWYGSVHTAGIAAVYNMGLSDTVEVSFISEYLIPPSNLEANMPEDMMIYLSWEHPVYSQPGEPDSIPENLIGYDIYRDGDSIARVYYPASEYWELPAGPFFESYEYSVEAVYLLIPYGFPGETGNSGAAGPAEIFVSSCCHLPFSENWMLGTYDQWYSVYCDNWIVNNNSGYPAPAAQFLGGSLQDYFCGFESWDLGLEYGDGIIKMEFDLRLDDLSSSGTEYFKLFIHSPDTMNEVFQISNQGSFGWTHYELDITEHTLNNPDYTFYFAATGEDGSNIANWSLDNIFAYFVCPAPYDLTADNYDEYVYLNWMSPDTAKAEKGLLGYDIYRDENGSGDWEKLNEVPFELDYYTDTIDSPGLYSWFVTSVFEGCESDPSNIAEITFTVGEPELHPDKILHSVYPNPADKHIFIEMESTDTEILLIDPLGKKIHRTISAVKGKIMLDCSNIPDGIYLLQLQTSETTESQKLIIRHKR